MNVAIDSLSGKVNSLSLVYPSLVKNSLKYFQDIKKSTERNLKQAASSILETAQKSPAPKARKRKRLNSTARVKRMRGNLFEDD